MTPLLKRAFDQASRRPRALQDSIAALVLTELESDLKWEESFARSQDTLSALAEEALGEHFAGLSEPLDPDTL